MRLEKALLSCIKLTSDKNLKLVLFNEFPIDAIKSKNITEICKPAFIWSAFELIIWKMLFGFAKANEKLDEIFGPEPFDVRQNTDINLIRFECLHGSMMKKTMDGVNFF